MRVPRLSFVCCENMHSVKLASSCSAKLALAMVGPPSLGTCTSYLPGPSMSPALLVFCVPRLPASALPCLVPGMPSPHPVPPLHFVQIVPKPHNLWSHTAILQFRLPTVPPTLSQDSDPQGVPLPVPIGGVLPFCKGAPLPEDCQPPLPPSISEAL